MYIDKQWFKDETGRTLILHGVNLGGSTKVPYAPDGATWRKEGFYDYRDVSFTGRPFPLEDADEHFTRLKAWGLTFIRLLITWEAIEHKGPGIYDQQYLEYLEQILVKAHQYGMMVFIDPHQDVWSRWTGGDGAPAWTLEKIGMDIAKLEPTGAAFTHNNQGDPFPRMVWPSNYHKLGAATMFTLFFAGNDFAPGTRVEGIPVQEYLQNHYIEAVKQVVKKVKHLPNVIGFDTMNEPSDGYIGLTNLASTDELRFKIGPVPSPYDGMLTGSGYTRRVYTYRFNFADLRKDKLVTLNPGRIKLWSDGHECIWKQHGVWTEEGGTPTLLKPDYFAAVRGRPVHFNNDYLQPFLKRFHDEIYTVKKDAVIFIEGLPAGEHPSWNRADGENVVNSGHWYDVYTLFRKKFSSWYTYDQIQRKYIIGRKQCIKSFISQLDHIKAVSREQMGGIPTIIGESGLPMDMNRKRAYRTGDFRVHIKAFTAYLDAMDANLLNFTLWNYTADNTNERGDKWNDEDLSLFSRDQQTDKNDLNSGGRGVKGFCRPYAMKTAGTPEKMNFDLKNRIFQYTFLPDPTLAVSTEIFIPSVHYPDGYLVELSAGRYEKDEKNSILHIFSPADAGITFIRVKVSPVIRSHR